MKTRTESIKVNGVDHQIEFEFINPFEPVEINSINGITSLNFVNDFINECESACSLFLRDEAFARSEAKAEAMSDESRGN
jgi:hypothetical protein